jgi:hypothetical protein
VLKYKLIPRCSVNTFACHAIFYLFYVGSEEAVLKYKLTPVVQ